MNKSELAYWLALWRIPNIGPGHFEQIIANLPSVADLFESPKEAIQQCSLSSKFLSDLLNPDWQNVEADLKWAEQPCHHIITRAMACYPVKLQEISNPPPLLFIQGAPELLNQPQLAIVGSRNPTITGSDTAHQFAKAFAHQKLIITSGLALGIDAACHEGVLAAKGKTIAIMGTGPDIIYPKRHLALARKIIESDGALVTEFPTGVPPVAANFPRRNRLISGLSIGVLVVEAAYGSGSLITAHYALEQNRDVFAIPGSIHNPLARGCHALIKQGAKLVETAQDVLDELQQWAIPQQMPLALDNNNSPRDLPKDQQDLLTCIGFETTAVDFLISRTGLTAEEVSSILLLLELEGYITATPGGYMRVK